MPQCHWHPDVETNIACPTCERYMCPKDMVPTPVGYKCKECAKPTKGQVAYVKPKQMLLGALTALGAAVVGAIVLIFLPLHFFLVVLAYGALVAEAARRGSGGHRGGTIAAIAGVAAAIGSLIAGFDPLSMGLAVVGAVGYSLANRF